MKVTLDLTENEKDILVVALSEEADSMFAKAKECENDPYVCKLYKKYGASLEGLVRKIKEETE